MSEDHGGADLHVHSTASDGSLTPSEVAREAQAAGLAMIALTDHETIAGLSEARTASEKGSLDLEVIAGVELSCRVSYGECHILGYFIDPESDELQERLEQLRLEREIRIEKMLVKLASLGIKLSLDDLKGVPRCSWGRAHVAEALLRKGYVKSFEQAFMQLIGRGRPGYVEHEKLTPKGAVEIIHSAGGAAVLAHPGTLQNDQLVYTLADLGLDGLECIYSTYDGVRRAHYEQMARKKDLIVTGGSDFHGAVKPHIALGDIRLPLENVRRLQERAAARRK